MMSGGLFPDRVAIYRGTAAKDDLRALVMTYPEEPTHDNVPANVQQGGRVGARDALVENRTTQYLNSPTSIWFDPDQDVQERDKIVVLTRGYHALSAAEQARETYYVEELKHSPVRQEYRAVSCGTTMGDDS